LRRRRRRRFVTNKAVAVETALYCDTVRFHGATNAPDSIRRRFVFFLDVELWIGLHYDAKENPTVIYSYLLYLLLKAKWPRSHVCRSKVYKTLLISTVMW